MPENEITVTSPVDSLPAPVRAIAPPEHKPQPPVAELSQPQREAIELLIVGKKSGDVAGKIGVHRGTLYRWRTYDANFIAVMNEWRKNLIAEMRDRVLAMSEKATDAVEKSITEGDARIALRVMDKLGVLTPGPVDPIDPWSVFGAGVEDEQERGPSNDLFRKVASAMSEEQSARVPALLALGVVVDNRRRGDSTPQHVLDLAGPLPPELSVAPQPGGNTTTLHVHIGDQVHERSDRTVGPPPATKSAGVHRIVHVKMQS